MRDVEAPPLFRVIAAVPLVLPSLSVPSVSCRLPPVALHTPIVRLDGRLVWKSATALLAFGDAFGLQFVVAPHRSVAPPVFVHIAARDEPPANSKDNISAVGRRIVVK